MAFAFAQELIPMYRIAQQTPPDPMSEQPCGARPPLKLQPSASVRQVCISLPDRLLCRYPDAAGRIVTYRIAVYSLGDNAHGVCFLMGVGRPEPDAAPMAAGAPTETAAVAAATVVTSVVAAAATSVASAVAPAVAAVRQVAFRIDRVDGLVTRIESGESLSVHMWERRVRQRFANDRQTDALPLSSILITDDTRVEAWLQTPDGLAG